MHGTKTFKAIIECVGGLSIMARIAKGAFWELDAIR